MLCPTFSKKPEALRLFIITRKEDQETCPREFKLTSPLTDE